METVTDFIFLGSKIPRDGDCSHEIKKRLHLGRKVMTKLDSLLKSRDITLPTKVHLVKDMTFPVVMYGCEMLLLNHEKTLGFLAPGGEFNPGPETRLDHSELLFNKVLLKYKRDRESF